MTQVLVSFCTRKQPFRAAFSDRCSLKVGILPKKTCEEIHLSVKLQTEGLQLENQFLYSCFQEFC